MALVARHTRSRTHTLAHLHTYTHTHPRNTLLLVPAGGLISAIFDETFGVLLYAAMRWGHFDVGMVFTARLEVDYKKVRGAVLVGAARHSGYVSRHAVK